MYKIMGWLWGWGWLTREKMCQEFTGSVTASQRTLQETWTSRSVSHPWHIVNLVDVFLIAGLSVRFFPAHFSSSQNNKNTKKNKKSKNANAGHTFEMGGMAGHDIWSENCVCVHVLCECGPAKYLCRILVLMTYKLWLYNMCLSFCYYITCISLLWLAYLIYLK